GTFTKERQRVKPYTTALITRNRRSCAGSYGRWHCAGTPKRYGLLTMRLLRGSNGGEFSLTEEILTDIPKYATLSHTWGPMRSISKILRTVLVRANVAATRSSFAASRRSTMA
ncbi:uncharacterized protein K444DRAFT_1690, partial [Hyaloscypha bicolor E]